MLTNFFLILLSTVLFVWPQEFQSDPIVKLPYGRVRGHVLKSSENKPFYAFQDVPFGKAPVGDLRFKEAQAPKPWNDVKNTTENKKKCVEFKAFGYIVRTDAPKENEDCLFVNVYTPQLPNNNASLKLLPVFFVIYGGAFTSGNGDYNYISPVHFMNYDLIIVVPSYRVGPLGLLYNGDDILPGNLALKDINYALKWTNENIALFGGDPKKITLGGISAGAAAVVAQMIHRESRGLFRGAIIQSGTMLCQWAIQKYPEYYAHELAMKLDSTITRNSTSEELLAVLNKVTVEELKNAKKEIVTPHGMELGPAYDDSDIWLPVLENKNAKNPFLTEPLLPLLKNGDFNKIPIVFGYTSEEETTLNKNETFLGQQSKLMDDDLKWVVNDLFDIPDDLKRVAGAEMRSVYTNRTFTEDFAGMYKFRSHGGFNNVILRHAEMQSNYTDVYLYELAHKGPLGTKNRTILAEGLGNVGHAEDETFMYGRRSFDMVKFPSSDILTRKRIVRMWTNFIIHLDPTPQEDPIFERIKWPKFNQTDRMHLKFNTTLSIAPVNVDKYLKWKAIMEKYEKNNS